LNGLGGAQTIFPFGKLRALSPSKRLPQIFIPFVEDPQRIADAPVLIRRNAG
jgi:hypothetical protein